MIPTTVYIQELEAEVARLNEQLKPYLEADEVERKRAAWQKRLELLVYLCIPAYNARHPKNEHPIRHPETAHWWNGASIVDTHFLANGDVRVEVKSYVGNNEHEDDEITLLKEWFELDNPASVVQDWCVKETTRREEARKEYGRKELIQKIESLTQQLNRLEK